LLGGALYCKNCYQISFQPNQIIR